MTDTIFAVSSGASPAAIAVLRISGPAAFGAGARLAGALPPPRRAGLRRLRDTEGVELDRALVLVFPGPASATGQDLLELHLHGGRAVVRAVEHALSRQPGLRAAEPGEFTRRALANGVIDLAQAEGLADLLTAETEAARRAALATAEGAVSRAAAAWQGRLFDLSARAEALIDFADEDDVPAAPEAVAALIADVAMLANELAEAGRHPPVERLHHGISIVLAGPPNSGKSSLINVMSQREVAIVTPIAGTTRDLIEAAVVRDGVAYRLIDSAGLRDVGEDAVEAIGMARARGAISAADLVVWLGDDPPPDPAMLAIHARADDPERGPPNGRLPVSAHTGAGIAALWKEMGKRTATLLPPADAIALNSRQRERVIDASVILATLPDDLLLLAESLRRARVAISQVTGADDIDGLLDTLFSRFCIGK